MQGLPVLCTCRQGGSLGLESGVWIWTCLKWPEGAPCLKVKIGMLRGGGRMCAVGRSFQAAPGAQTWCFRRDKQGLLGVASERGRAGAARLKE